MLNRYPLWKYLLLIFVTVLGFIYAVPNLYMPDAAVQISGDSSTKVMDAAALSRIENALKAADIEYFGAEVNEKAAMVRIKNRDQQMLARTSIQNALGDGYVSALKDASTTPQWLQSLGAAPMSLGLDLAGGVHFLLEVDTQSVVATRLDTNADEMKTKLRDAKLRYVTLVVNKNNEIVGTFRSAEVRDQAISNLRKEFGNMLFTEVDAAADSADFSFVASFSEITIREIEDYA
jgi:preprotein translocase subunit SecD